MIVNYVIWQTSVSDAVRYWDTATSNRVAISQQNIALCIQKNHTPRLLVVPIAKRMQRMMNSLAKVKDFCELINLTTLIRGSRGVK
jgi:hypothetical protein